MANPFFFALRPPVRVPGPACGTHSQSKFPAHRAGNLLVCGVGSASVAFADVGRDTVAPLADGDAQAERYVHRTLLDGNPLRRVLRSQHVGCQIEIDPVGAEVQRQADGSAAVVDHRIASRHREPAHGVEIDRSGDVVHGLVFPDAGRVEQADADFVAPHFVFESGVDRRVEHLGRAAPVDLVEFQHFEVEIRNRLRGVFRNRGAREFRLLRRDAHDGVFLAPADESQVGHGQRRLQVGQDVVRGAQVEGKAVSCGFGGFEVEIAYLEGLAVGVRFDFGPGGREVQRALGENGPAVFAERDVEAVVGDQRTGESGEELTADADVEAVVHQRERVAESRLEVGVRRGAEVADLALLAEFDEFEERVGQVGVFVDPHVEVERPEILVVFGKGAESDDVYAEVWE